MAANPCAEVTSIRVRVDDVIFRPDMTDEELAQCDEDPPVAVNKLVAATVDARIGTVDGDGKAVPCVVSSFFYGRYEDSHNACHSIVVPLNWHGQLAAAHGWHVIITLSGNDIYSGFVRFETNPGFSLVNENGEAVTNVEMANLGEGATTQQRILKVVNGACDPDAPPIANSDICFGGGGGGGGGGGPVLPAVPTPAPIPKAPGEPTPDCIAYPGPTQPLDDCLFFGRTVSLWGCIPLPSDGSTCAPASYSEACKDQLWAWDNKEKCLEPPESIFRIAAGAGIVDLGSEYQVPAWIEFSNGRKSYIGTHDEMVWTSMNPAVLQFIGLGVFRGIAAGVAQVQADWRGLRAVADITVTDPGSTKTDPIDLVIVRETETGTTGSDGQPSEWADVLRMDMLANVQLSMHLKRSWNTSIGVPRDRVAVLGFGSGVQEISGWTDSVVLRYPAPSGTDGRVSIGAGLDYALQLFKSARAGTRKVVALLSSGCESVCSPNPSQTAKALEADGVVIYAIGMSQEGAFGVDCANTTSTEPANPQTILAGCSNAQEWAATPGDVAASAASLVRRSAAVLPPIP